MLGNWEVKEKEEGLGPTGSLHPIHRLGKTDAPGGAGAEGALLPYWPKSQPLLGQSQPWPSSSSDHGQPPAGR